MAERSARGSGFRLGRALALSLRILRQFRRDRRTLGLVFLVPVFVMGMLTYLTDTTTRPRLAVLAGEGRETAAARVEEALRRDDKVDLVDLSGRDARAVVRAREVDAVVVLGAEPRLIVEGSEPQVTAATLAALSRALQQGASLLDVEYIHGGPEMRAMDYYAPAFIPFIVFFFTFMLTAVAFLRERTQGTMERLLAAPLGSAEILLGYLGGFLVFALAQSLIILVLTVYGLGIEFRGGFGAVFLVVAIFTVFAVNLGIFLSAFARNELQAVQFIPLVLYPQILLGDFIFRVADMSALLRPLAAAMPLTYASRALREVVIRGGGIPEVSGDLLALGAFAAGAMVLSALTLRRGAW